MDIFDGVGWQLALFTACLLGIHVKLLVLKKFWGDFDREREYLLDVPVYFLLQTAQWMCLCVAITFIAANSVGLHMAIGLSRSIRIVALYIRLRKNNKPLRVYDDLEYIPRGKPKFAFSDSLIRNVYPNTLTLGEWVGAFRNAALALTVHITMATSVQEWFIVAIIFIPSIVKWFEISKTCRKFIKENGGASSKFETRRVFSFATMASMHIVTDILMCIIYATQSVRVSNILFVFAEIVQLVVDEAVDVQYYFYLSSIHSALMDRAAFVFDSFRIPSYARRKAESDSATGGPSGYSKMSANRPIAPFSGGGITVTELDITNSK